MTDRVAEFANRTFEPDEARAYLERPISDAERGLLSANRAAARRLSKGKHPPLSNVKVNTPGIRAVDALRSE